MDEPRHISADTHGGLRVRYLAVDSHGHNQLARALFGRRRDVGAGAAQVLGMCEDDRNQFREATAWSWSALCGGNATTLILL